MRLSPLADTIVLLSRADPEDPAGLCLSVCREPSRIKKRCAKFILEKTFRELTFRGVRRIRENRENYVPREFGRNTALTCTCMYCKKCVVVLTT